MKSPIRLATCALFAGLLVLGGCGKKESGHAEDKADEHAHSEGDKHAEHAKGDKHAEHAKGDKHGEHAGHDHAKGADKAAAPKAAPAKAAGLTLTAKGTNFDPSVEVATLPAGAWYCDMGKSHYARSEEGDSKCARCGMKLKHKAVAAN